MWKCERCGEEIEDQFKACWKCAEPESTTSRPAIECLRCETEMEYQGRKHLHEGEWIEGTHRLPVDAYVCPRCGHLELFAGEVGKELRPE